MITIRAGRPISRTPFAREACEVVRKRQSAPLRKKQRKENENNENKETPMKTNFSRIIPLALVALAFTLTTAASAVDTLTTLYKFKEKSDGEYPQSGLTA